MMQFFQNIFEQRIFALLQKETRQILRDRQMLFLLIFPPTFQLFLYGFALSPDVHNLQLAVCDYSKTPISRELVAAVTENQVFDVAKTDGSERVAAADVGRGKTEAGLIIPPEFNRRIKRGEQSPVQIFLDGVDANTAGIANGYLIQMIGTFSRTLQPPSKVGTISPQVSFLYNPGLESSWFFIPGVMGLVLNLTGTLVSSATLVREKDSGTLEQLVMTPASALEVLMAKILPLFFLLMGNVCVSLSVGLFAFNVPFRGNPFLFFGVSALYVFVGIAFGITLASISKNQRQAILTSFFINLPVIQLSGAIAPINSMPPVFQYLSLLNPLRYYVVCLRSILLRGVGLDIIWMDVTALAVFAIVLMTLSASRFRSQLN